MSFSEICGPVFDSDPSCGKLDLSLLIKRFEPAWWFFGASANDSCCKANLRPRVLPFSGLNLPHFKPFQAISRRSRTSKPETKKKKGDLMAVLCSIFPQLSSALQVV